MINKSHLLILLLSMILFCCSHRSKNDSFTNEKLNVNRWKERFESRERDVYARKNQIIKAMNIQKASVLTDIGAGTGAFVESFINIVGSNGKVFAIDISPGFVQYLRNRKIENNWTNLTVVLGEVGSTTLGENIADLVFLCETFQFFDAPKKMLVDIRKLLKREGKLFIVDSYKSNEEMGKEGLHDINITKTQLIARVNALGFQYQKEHFVGLRENFMLEFSVREDRR